MEIGKTLYVFKIELPTFKVLPTLYSSPLLPTHTILGFGPMEPAPQWFSHYTKNIVPDLTTSY
jgi:hypothetical protein